MVKEMKRGNGIISKKDLKNYHSVWRRPVSGMYKGYKVISMPPPSSGGIALISLFQSVEKYPLKEWGFQSEKRFN
jgi:Gamma-glutamyltransferase